jgi:hypothetical protein
MLTRESTRLKRESRSAPAPPERSSPPRGVGGAIAGPPNRKTSLAVVEHERYADDVTDLNTGQLLR